MYRDPDLIAITNGLAVVTSEHPYYAPAITFEQKTGLRGVHTAWVMPNGLTAEQADQRGVGMVGMLMHSSGCNDFEELTRMLTTSHKVLGDEITRRFDELVLLNPTLATLSHMRDNPVQAETIIHGVTSQFNLDDITFAISATPEEHTAANVQRHRVHDRAGHYMEWITSPKTMDRIEAQLDARDAVAKKKPGAKPGSSLIV